jgi:L-amino acid N-acyltransferase YncA
VNLSVPVIRHAEPALDGAPCAAIYAASVVGSAASFEEAPPGPAEMTSRIERTSAGHPWLVAERGGAVAGYAYASRHRERAAYRWAADVAVYVAEEHRGVGVGAELYDALIGLLRRQRLRAACAGISLPNPASVALHEALGFRRVGVFPRIGHKAGAWHDVGWWQLDLAPDDDGTPPEPLGPQRLD